MAEELLRGAFLAVEQLRLRQLDRPADRPRLGLGCGEHRAGRHKLTKLGCVREGTFRQDCVLNGEVSDSWVFGLIRQEWRPASAAPRGEQAEWTSSPPAWPSRSPQSHLVR